MAHQIMSLIAFASVLGAACGTSNVQVSDSLSQVASKAEAELGQCDLDGDFLHPLGQVDQVRDTGRLVRIVSYEAEVNELVVELEAAGATATRTFRNEPDSAVHALEWGQSNFETVHVAETSTDRIGFAVGQWDDERAVVIQPCANHFVGGLFEQTYGDDHESKLLAFMTGDPATRGSTVAELSASFATGSTETIEGAGAQTDARDPWGNSGGLITAADAIVTAEVLELTGPAVTLQPNGNVQWSLEESDRIAEAGGGVSEFMPGLAVRVTGVLADDGDIRPEVGSELHVIHSAGVLRTGVEYALLIGPESGESSKSRWLTYAHDLQRDEPADGFRFGTEAIMADIAAARAGDSSNLTTIVAFNGDIHAGRARSGSRAALFERYVGVEPVGARQNG